MNLSHNFITIPVFGLSIKIKTANIDVTVKKTKIQKPVLAAAWVPTAVGF